MAISFWHLLGQAALLDWLFGKKKPVVQPTRSSVDYVAMNERISNLEDKVLSAQSRLDDLQDKLDERLDQDSAEYFEMERQIDDAEFELMMMENEVEHLRDDFDDDLDDY